MDNLAQKEIEKTLSKKPSLLDKLAVAAIVGVPLSANAAIDISTITTLIGEAVVAAGVIGLGFLGFKAGIAIFKNLRGAA